MIQRTSNEMTVGVVVLTHTQDHLVECLESIAAQTHQPARVVVVDNASPRSHSATDLCWRFPVETIRLDEPVSPSAARNRGCELLDDCDAIMCFDGDDIMKPALLDSYRRDLRATGVDVVFGAAELFGTDEGIWFPGAELGRKPNLRNRSYIPINALFLRRLWEQVGGFDPEQLFFEDWDFWLSCATVGASFHGVSEPLWRYRRHDASQVARATIEAKDEMRSRIYHKHLDYIRGPFQWRRALRIVEKAGEKAAQLLHPVALARLIGGRAVRCIASFGPSARRQLWPRRNHPPLYEGSWFDDLLWGQTFNPVMRAIWLAGRRRRVSATGATVIVVSWNTCEVLKSVLGAVREHSPAGTKIIVIDNGSSDGTAEWLRDQELTDRCVLLPFNIGHGRGLDIGFALATTETVITLDSDAFPFRDDWLDILTEPLEQSSVQAAGMWGKRNRLHPACAAFRRTAFYDARMSFTNYTPWMDRGEAPVFGENSWDTAELLFERIGPDRVVLHPVSANEHGGSTMSNAVYHHEQMTTVQIDLPKLDAQSRRESWNRAVEDLLAAD